MKKSVLVFDDCQEDLDKAVAELRSFEELEVTSFSSPEHLLRFAQSKPPDIAVIDLIMNEKYAGLGVISGLRSLCFDTFIVAHTSVRDGRILLDAYDSGADDCAIKSSNTDSLTFVLRNHLDGENYLSPMIARFLEERYHTLLKIGRAKAQLTVNELEILHEIGNGLLSKEVADKRGVAGYVVENAKRKFRQLLKRLSLKL